MGVWGLGGGRGGVERGSRISGNIGWERSNCSFLKIFFVTIHDSNPNEVTDICK